MAARWNISVRTRFSANPRLEPKGRESQCVYWLKPPGLMWARHALHKCPGA